jgi:hypothetical protein
MHPDEKGESKKALLFFVEKAIRGDLAAVSR